MTSNELIERLKSSDEKTRGYAWQNAGPVGVKAVKPLADLMASSEMETARAAKRALWNIVRWAGRPKASDEQQAVVSELVPLIAAGSPSVRREFIWMLSEIGGDEAVASIGALLPEKELREDARAALQRIPGNKALRPLKLALKSGPEEYRSALAVSLRVRGEKVDGYPSQKLVPTKRTGVKQLPA
jgi:hypothetical protein